MGGRAAKQCTHDRCGHVNRAAARYCARCGRPLDPDSLGTVASQSGRNGYACLVLGLLVAVGLGLLTGFGLLGLAVWSGVGLIVLGRWGRCRDAEDDERVC